eukprot:773000-Pyramimonas_sp.AAC.1
MLLSARESAVLDFLRSLLLALVLYRRFRCPSRRAERRSTEVRPLRVLSCARRKQAVSSPPLSLTLLGVLDVHNVGNYRFGLMCPSRTVQHTLKMPL